MDCLNAGTEDFQGAAEFAQLHNDLFELLSAGKMELNS
jgi:hypothetical protein